MIKNNPIKHCRSCLSRKLINILSLGEQYLSDFSEGDDKPEKSPLDLILCRDCNLLQLKNTVSPALLYTERYGYKSGINQTMKKELKEIAEKSVKKVKDQKFKELIVVDIGANDGTLLSNYPEDIFRIGIEPIKKFAKECTRHANIVINDFFNYKSFVKKIKNKKAHIITAISCFYDIEDPNLFLSDIGKILHKDGVFVIQQNYLVSMLENNAFDNIVHEHLEHYSLLSLEKLLNRHNLEIFSASLSEINGGSIRAFISHRGRKKISTSINQLRTHESKIGLNDKRIYEKFAIRVKKNKKDLRRFLKKLVLENKTIYIYGASTRGNTLLQFYKLNNRLIKAAVERNSEKWGKKISSVGIPIISEEQGRLEKPDYMLVLPWFFKDEFLKREKKYIELGGHFIFPLPKLEVI